MSLITYSTVPSLTISASASLYDHVGAIMALYVNDQYVGSQTVTGTEAQDYQFDIDPYNITFGAENTKISIVFPNDAYSRTQDRNLTIHSVTYGPAPAYSFSVGSDASIPVYYDKGLGTAALDGIDVLSGRSTLTSNGAFTFSLPTQDLFIDPTPYTYQNEGTPGDDVLYGSNSSVLNGGDGNDTFYDLPGNETFIGGSGRNTYILGNGPSDLQDWVGDSSGDNVISYSITDAQGQKRYDDTVTRNDTIDMNHIFNASFHRDGDDLVITGYPYSDAQMGGYENLSALSTFRVEYYFDAHTPVSKIMYGNRDLSVQDISKLIQSYGDNTGLGTQGNDSIILSNETMNTTSDSRIIHGREGNDIISCGSGQNTVYGDQGNDTIKNAKLAYGGSGNDTYIYSFDETTAINLKGPQTTQATIIENDNTKGNQDVLLFENTASDQLWLTKSGQDLTISVIGTDHQVTIQNWYGNTAHRVEQIKAETTSGHTSTLTDTNVSKLVNAMATMTPPAAGQTTLPANEKVQLAAVLAASWK